MSMHIEFTLKVAGDPNYWKIVSSLFFCWCVFRMVFNRFRTNKRGCNHLRLEPNTMKPFIVSESATPLACLEKARSADRVTKMLTGKTTTKSLANASDLHHAKRTSASV